MFRAADIHSLTSFLRDHKATLERLEKSGRPEVLTVNGKAKVVIQDADAYQRMMELADLAQSAMILKERLAAVDRGEPGIPVDEAFEMLRKRNAARKKRSA
ncbi:MAG TPA: type II toxin-antitoxin system Phd/YefM family antitoxin [Phycisphaerales bacterium]|nr:type II toxin-antitoxin system Phd/YefM family antitoxin [Phycisphaerales bacterium]